MPRRRNAGLLAVAVDPVEEALAAVCRCPGVRPRVLSRLELRSIAGRS
jgi:hypothetical protein